MKIKSRLALLLLTLVAVLAVFSPIVRGNVVDAKGSNGQNARPFYNVAHNPNALSEAITAFDAGANALEPDIMRFSDSAVSPTGNINATAGPSGLFMYHDDVVLTTRMPDTVESYFDTVHTLAKAGKNVALITLDIKSPAAEYLGLDGAAKLRNAVATHLNYDGVNVNIVYSVGTTADSNYFMDNICLGPRDGIMIDGENDAAGILNVLIAHITAANTHAAANCGGNPVPYNIGFGNGSIGESLGLAPSVLPSIMQASWIRAGQPNAGNIAIPYAYPIEPASRMHDYITAGVDGLIPDVDSVLPQFWPNTLVKLAELAAIVAARSDVYMATAAEDPFHPPNEAYGLRVNTADVSGAGTDALLTFKLTGTCGSSQVTIDSSYQGLFERADRNYVTLQSKNLGVLQSLEVSSNGSCAAITGATWSPGGVQISSARWGIPYSDDRTVDFAAADVCTGTSRVVNTGSWGRDCDTTAPSASASQSPAATAAGWNNSNVTVNWNWSDNAGGSGIDSVRCTNSSTASGEGTHTLTATCRDLDGNIGTASRTVYIDTTPPTVNCGTADGVWHAANTSVNCTASDGPSGLASAGDAAFALTTAVAAETETAAAFTGSRTVFDLAANSSTAGPIGGNKVDKKAPVITITQPAATTYVHSATLTLGYIVVDGGSGLATFTPKMDGSTTVTGLGLPNGRAINLLTALPLGAHTFTIDATDNVANARLGSVTFTIIVTPASVIEAVNQLLASGAVGAKSRTSLLAKLTNAAAQRSAGRCGPAANMYQAFINEVSAQTGKSITPTAAAILIADARYLIAHCPS